MQLHLGPWGLNIGVLIWKSEYFKFFLHQCLSRDIALVMTVPIQVQEDATNPVSQTVEVTQEIDQCHIHQEKKNFENLLVPPGEVIEVEAIQGAQEYWDLESECLLEGDWLRVHMVFENEWFLLERMTTTED